MKIVSVTDVKSEGLEALLGEKVLLFCTNYFYAGTLIGVNETCVKLEGAGIVYETGKFSDAAYKDFQLLPANVWYVAIGAIESFGLGK